MSRFLINGQYVDDVDLSNNLNNQIEIRPRLKGGAEEVKIICTNANGYPSTKNN